MNNTENVTPQIPANPYATLRARVQSLRNPGRRLFRLGNNAGMKPAMVTEAVGPTIRNAKAGSFRTGKLPRSWQ